MSTSGKRSGLRPAGIAVAIIAVLAAIGLWYSAGERETDAVRKLARAPIGCDTTLDFAVPGEFLLFIETTGVVDEVPGDCGTVGPFERTDASVPAPVVSMVDPDGNPVALDSSTGVSYSADGRTGQSIRTLTVETPGDHVITVESPTGDDEFVVAVGRDPSGGVAPLRTGAVAAAVIGLLLGGALIVAGSRKNAASVAEQTPGGWPGAGVAPVAPPGMPTAPPASSWQPAVGPPTAPPAMPIPVPGEPTPAVGSVPPPPPMQPSTPPGPAPSGPVIADRLPSGERSPWAPQHVPTDGASGDGEHSPWGPPSDTPS